MSWSDSNDDNDNNTRPVEHVIRTTYPQEPSGTSHELIVRKLQIEIMEQLSISHEASSTSIVTNANAISEFLSGKKYILLLDHVTFEVDLGALGLRDDLPQRKVVIASRDLKTIRRMHVDHEVKIEKLVEDDAWSLFKIAHGEVTDGRKEMIGKNITECCGGIPWMIDNVAKHLRGKHESSWNDVLRCLQSDSVHLDLIGLGGMDNLYKMMYEELMIGFRKCLLYGALFPNHHKIYKDYLIECWIAEGFIVQDSVKRVRGDRERGHTILDVLTERHFLSWCSDQMHIQMPLNFRRVALKLDTNCLTWAPSNDLQPDEDIWSTKVTRMSLIGCKTELPKSPNCQNIQTLQLQSLKPELKQLEDSFFEHMKNLNVLDLNHTGITELPRSIDSLANLKSLYLNDCNHLVALPSQANKLVKLQFLDISGTSISSLPQQICFMVDLRCLRASFAANSRGNKSMEIPPGIISKLTKLEELSIVTTFDCKGGATIATELATLDNLSTLCFNFPDVSSVDTFVNSSISLNNIDTSYKSHTFRSYKIFIGSCPETQHPYKSVFSGILAERWLRYSTDKVISNGCKELLKQASAFELIGNGNVQKLSHFDMKSVKICVVASCSKLENIVDGNANTELYGITQENTSLDLEKLYLFDLQLLQCICDGADSSKSLSKLTAITINLCPKLTKIMDPALAQTLKSLQFLKVENCCEVTEIIEVVEWSSSSNQADPFDILQSLRSIEVTKLPKLKSICKSTSISWSSLNSIIITSCPDLCKLPFSYTNAKRLQVIQCEKNLWDTLKLPDDLRQRLHPF